MATSYRMRMWRRHTWLNRARIIGIIIGATAWAIVTAIGIWTLLWA